MSSCEGVDDRRQVLPRSCRCRSWRVHCSCSRRRARSACCRRLAMAEVAAGAALALNPARAQAAAGDGSAEQMVRVGAGAGALALLVAPELLDDPVPAGHRRCRWLPSAQMSPTLPQLLLLSPQAGRVGVVRPGVEADVGVGRGLGQLACEARSVVWSSGAGSVLAPAGARAREDVQERPVDQRDALRAPRARCCGTGRIPRTCARVADAHRTAERHVRRAGGSCRACWCCPCSRALARAGRRGSICRVPSRPGGPDRRAGSCCPRART